MYNVAILLLQLSYLEVVIRPQSSDSAAASHRMSELCAKTENLPKVACLL